MLRILRFVAGSETARSPPWRRGLLLLLVLLFVITVISLPRGLGGPQGLANEILGQDQTRFVEIVQREQDFGLLLRFGIGTGEAQGSLASPDRGGGFDRPDGAAKSLASRKTRFQLDADFLAERPFEIREPDQRPVNTGDEISR